MSRAPAPRPRMASHTAPGSIGRHKLVEFTYRILDENNGEVLEQIDLPVSYVHGSEHGLWERVEAALENRRAGDTVEVLVRPEDAFGEQDPSLLLTQSADEVPEQFRHIGAEAEFQNERGNTRTFRVTRIDGDQLTLDGNHPMAGKTLRFFLNILAVRDATEDEIQDPDSLSRQPPLH